MKRVYITDDYLLILNRLTDEQAGKLIKGIMVYLNGGVFMSDDIVIQSIFQVFKLQIDQEYKRKPSIYIESGHLSITWEEMNKLIDQFGDERAKEKVNAVLNWSKNSKCKSLYLTALNWLNKDEKNKSANKTSKISSHEFKIISSKPKSTNR